MCRNTNRRAGTARNKEVLKAQQIHVSDPQKESEGLRSRDLKIEQYRQY
jgi:hypothetical protein